MQTTSQTWKDLYASGTARLEARAVIAGVTYTDVAPVITRALTQAGPAVGNAAAASCALSLRGVSGSAIPRSAAVAVSMRLTDGSTSSEWLPAGTFFLSKRSRDPVAGLLYLECYDALLKADAPWEPSAGSWPRAIGDVADELADLLGLDIDARTVIPTGGVYYMNEPEAGTTIRDALGTIAQLVGGNWTVTPANRLRLVPFAPSAPDAVTVAGVMGGVDVGEPGEVTGIRCADGDETVLVGDDTGVVLDVTLAPVLAADLLDRMEGAEYRPFSLTSAVCDPACELGDGIAYGSGVAGLLCAFTGTLGPAFRASLSAPFQEEVADEYPYIGKADKVLHAAKAYAREAVADLDDALTQEDIFNRLTDNGAAQGMILYNGQLYVNASYINTGYLNADHIRGGTLTLGGQNNQNGTLTVLDASGNVIGSWDMDGIYVSGGAIEIITSGGSVKLGDGSYPLTVDYLGQNSTGTDQHHYHLAMNNGVLEFYESSSDYATQYNKVEFTPDGLKFYQAASGGAGPVISLQDYDNQLQTNIQYGQIELFDSVGGGDTTLRYDGIQTPSLALGTPLDIPNGGHGGTTAAQGRTNLSVYSKAEVDSLVGAKLYSVRGNIVKSASTGTAVGYGKAVVYIVGKTVVVEFEAKITTAGTLSGVYDIGIQVANLRTINSGIPAFTVSNGGIIHYYKDDGAMDTRMEGYAGEATLNTSENRWAFGRLYDTSGSIGAWADNNYSAGKIITGTLYGVLN